MQTTRKLTRALLALAAFIALNSAAFAADPGDPFPASSEISDLKTGSVSIGSFYTSSATDPSEENTAMSIINTDANNPAIVHVFFIEGSTCSVADSFVCLTANQTASFLASDVDPGVTGYTVSVTTDSFGVPVANNKMKWIGCIKTKDGHQGWIYCWETSALFPGLLPGVLPTDSTATLVFDGIAGYNRIPRVLATPSIPSLADDNRTILIINRIGGNLATSAAPLGPIFGILYDDQENAASFTFTSAACQFRSNLSNSFPRTTPRFGTFVQSGHTGWMKFFSLSDIGIIGTVLNHNPNTRTSPTAFNGVGNLIPLTLATSVTLTIPIFPPNC